ncbi:aspartyl/glutamyl-tRNA(Asn/Gln) amidotransferase subunit B [Rhizobium phage P9VFCI]|uniref:Aspartyl/glutamyl-tRNA(Asn/Gln) amidotransferase subunit B n=1 Tax=Rhizobium phage P9VFCI TaxID=2763531 RepID=A0A7G7WXL3_9CAUD|nr:aspartyl/glutamyl-tRNA(Asn/Gln) amidotransferase subunit B [Rhizobium phage P9VFCI]QNH71957.1 aspartyl/glutamyl-tRNA(Asn/Gln) amidotransferase subunit B [Rhizobium phage P9VFCI]
MEPDGPLTGGLPFHSDETMMFACSSPTKEDLSNQLDELIADNQDKAKAVFDKPQLIDWFVGQIMKKHGGKPDPNFVRRLAEDKLILEV